MKILFVMAFVLILSQGDKASAASSEDFKKASSGNGFLRLCDKYHNKDLSFFIKGYCMGFIRGIETGLIRGSVKTLEEEYGKGFPDKIRTKYTVSPSPAFPTCSAGIQYGQQMRVFIKYLRKNPEFLHLSVPSLFEAAMNKAFPCPTK